MQQQTPWIRLACSGALAGIANGFFGAGGGMILVPLLARWCHLEERTVFPTAICMILPLCAVSLFIYLQNGALDVPAAVPYLVGGAVGGLLGGLLYPKIPTKWLHRALGLLIVYGGVRLALW